MKKVAVIGGGVAGLAAADILASAGHKVTVYEKLGRLGGLARTFKIGDTRLECFYHHIFSSDYQVIDLVNQVGKGNDLIWRTSPMGFFSDGKVWDFGGPKDLLTYQPLSFLDRIKFGVMALYLQRLNDWKPLERYTVQEWVEGKWRSPGIYRKVWEPLLKRKFGPGYEKTTAAWLWGRVNPRAKSRSKGGAKEQLGYMRGSFETFIEALGAYVQKQGVEVKTGTTVTEMRRKDDGGYVLTVPEEGCPEFDAVIFTGSMDVLAAVTPQLPDDYRKKALDIPYTGCICFVMELKQPLTHIYWLNIADPDVNFGGLIGQTNFMTPADYGGNHVVYVFNYLENTHRYYNLGREELLQEYLPALKKMFPQFREDWILRTYAFKDNHATPTYTGPYSTKIPACETPLPGLFLGCTAQIYPEDRNMNNSIIKGQEAAKKCVEWLKVNS